MGRRGGARINTAEWREQLDALAGRLHREEADWFAALFESDEHVRAAMDAIEAVPVDAETAELLQRAMVEILAAAADVAVQAVSRLLGESLTG